MSTCGKLSVQSWLQSLQLSSLYLETFETNLYTEMERIFAIWDDELTSILDIEKIGHRKRILLSLAGREGMKHRFGKVKASNHGSFHSLSLYCVVSNNGIVYPQLGQNTQKSAIYGSRNVCLKG